MGGSDVIEKKNSLEEGIATLSLTVHYNIHT